MSFADKIIQKSPNIKGNTKGGANPQIIPVVYEENKVNNNFEKMIKDQKNSKALFIFNDNVEHHETFIKGKRNAAIRPFNKYGKNKQYPRSAGISTGSNGKGFEKLTFEIKKTINSNVNEIKDLIKKYKYEKIYWSAAPNSNGKLLGSSTFTVGKDVKKYIVDQIEHLGFVKRELSEQTISVGPTVNPLTHLNPRNNLNHQILLNHRDPLIPNILQIRKQI